MRKTILTAMLAALSSPAAAQTMAETTDWTFALSLYGWLPAVNTDVNTPRGTVSSNMSGSDAISDLEFAFMGTTDAQRGRWSLIGDLIYADLGTSSATPFGLAFSKADVDVKMTAFSGYAGYRVYDTPSASVDILGGFRLFSVDLDVALRPGFLEGESFGESETWVDPLIGARATFPINDQWFATAAADFGGTSSDDTTWQALATVGYAFNERWSAQLAYRYMSIKKEIGSLDTEIELYGPLIGATYRF